jgi:hypothetical protein
VGTTCPTGSGIAPFMESLMNPIFLSMPIGKYRVHSIKLGLRCSSIVFLSPSLKFSEYEFGFAQYPLYFGPDYVFYPFSAVALIIAPDRRYTLQLTAAMVEWVFVSLTLSRLDSWRTPESSAASYDKRIP